MFAIVDIKGKQYKVSENDRVFINRIKDTSFHIQQVVAICIIGFQVKMHFDERGKTIFIVGSELRI